MKCPKCDYLGFETGDRCKNCGYDFSLLTTRSAPGSPTKFDPRELPLFSPPGEDDEPLIKLPVAPRPPLSVRKTPDSSRVRGAVAPAPRVRKEPLLEFPDDVPDLDLRLKDDGLVLDTAVDVLKAPASSVTASRVSRVSRVSQVAPSGAGRRLGAALIDHLILLAVDATVVYFTLRMAALPPADWRLLPPIPLLAFLGFLKFAYFCAFTAVGGQTIGKMAMGLCVVTDDNGTVDPSCAIRRTLAGVTAIALGLGFIPALVGPDRRAFHDRIARTRVVGRRSA